MAIPPSVEARFGIYTLACHELVQRLSDLDGATQSDARLDYETCLILFDEALKHLFERTIPPPQNLKSATEKFCGLIRAQADLFRDSNGKAAGIFDDVVAEIRNKASSWDYQADLDQLHIQGHDLACRFFNDAPHAETETRLNHHCQLVTDYGEADADDIHATRRELFGYPAAPAAYYAHYYNNEKDETISDVVLIRFTFRHDLTLYLAYPLLFLHEYTAHVYSTDLSDEIFGDGWMLYAAAAFLQREWQLSADRLGLGREQACVFHERLRHRLNPIPRRNCSFAEMFDGWLSIYQPKRFMQITHELAEFRPQPGERPVWPMQFINALTQEFNTDKDRLLRKIRSTTTIRELMTTLQPA